MERGVSVQASLSLLRIMRNIPFACENILFLTIFAYEFANHAKAKGKYSWELTN